MSNCILSTTDFSTDYYWAQNIGQDLVQKQRGMNSCIVNLYIRLVHCSDQHAIMVKPIYNGQPRAITQVAFVDKRVAFVRSVRNYLSDFHWDELKLVLVDRKPLLAGDL